VAGPVRIEEQERDSKHSEVTLGSDTDGRPYLCKASKGSGVRYLTAENRYQMWGSPEYAPATALERLVLGGRELSMRPCSNAITAISNVLCKRLSQAEIAFGFGVNPQA
jgi:hypothetical protein